MTIEANGYTAYAAIVATGFTSCGYLGGAGHVALAGCVLVATITCAVFVCVTTYDIEVSSMRENAKSQYEETK